jgi:molecular chaperone DnaK
MGAGTLDLSVVVLGDRVHEVEAVFGDNEFGGNDIDRAIASLLARNIERQHDIRVPETGLSWRRLLVAAEHLKITLSSTERATYVLPGFLDRDIDIEVTLTEQELRTTIDDLLGPLRQVCQDCLGYLRGERPRGFLPVGGQMLAPIVRQGVASALNLTALSVNDPRTLVARGACLQAAVIEGALEDTLLLDVVPFSLGIKVRRDTASGQSDNHFSRLIERHTTIPTKKTAQYTTVEDNQVVVQIGVYQGEHAKVEDNVKMGEFLLEGIQPAPKGTPQINVTFDIDASGVLNVTAVDKGTEKTRAIRIEDTTMLSPHERTELTKRFAADRAISLEHERIAAVCEELQRTRQEIEGDRLIGIYGRWRQLLTAYESAPSDYLPASDDGAVLVDMFRRRAETEAAAMLAAERAAKLRHELDALITAAYGEAETATVQGLAEALLRRVRDTAWDLSSLYARIAHWTAALGHLEQSARDPLKRLAACHAAGKYAQALIAFDELRQTSGDPPPKAVWEAALECFAATDDRTGYRACLLDCGRVFVANRLDFGQLDGSTRRVRDSIAWINMSAGGATGFLVSDRLVATAHSSISRAHDVVVTLRGVELPAMSVVTRNVCGHDLALIRLPRSVDAPPLRLGFVQLVEVGEAIAVMAAPLAKRKISFHDGLVINKGIMNRFWGVEPRSRILELSIRAQPEMNGSPVFNDLGEVIGVMASPGIPPGDGASAVPPNFSQAVNVDALRDMLIANAQAEVFARAVQ